MKEDKIDILISQWNRIGTWFTGPSAKKTPDLERLLLDTARNASGCARLFVMTYSWLNLYGDVIARHRFKRLIIDELEPEYWPVMGLLLDSAQQGTQPLRFEIFIKLLRSSDDRSPRPLDDLSNSNPGFFELSRRRASPISKKWGLWTDEIQFKFDSIRPYSWIMDQNPEFAERSIFRGDLRASIMAALHYDKDAGNSETQLVAASGGSRSQVRNNLDNLERNRCAKRTPAGNKTHINLITPASAA